MTEAKHSFRWGIPLLDDAMPFIPIYRFMLHNYAKAGISRDEFLCITHLADYRYETEDGQSSPAIATVAKQMGYAHENSVRNLIKSLKDKKMLTIEPRDGLTSVYEFSGFALKMLALWAESHSDVPLHSSVPLPLHRDVPPPLQPNVPEEEELKKNKSKKNDSAPLGAKTAAKAKLDTLGRAINNQHPDWLGFWEAVLTVRNLTPDKLTNSMKANIAKVVTEIIQPQVYDPADVLYFPTFAARKDWNDWTVNAIPPRIADVRAMRLGTNGNGNHPDKATTNEITPEMREFARLVKQSEKESRNANQS